MKQSRPLTIACALFTVLCLAGPAAAWGDFGHKVTAIIAWKHLTPAVKQRVKAILASDTDSLTPPDFASRSTWADVWAKTHRDTAPWHFMNVEIDRPDMEAACVSPAQACIVDRINTFSAKLKDPATPTDERAFALKFLVHLVGDLHQPLHVADHHDRGGNCVRLAPSPDGDVASLHLFWDITAPKALGPTPESVAARLDAATNPRQRRAWSRGDAKAWAQDSLDLGMRDAYNLPVRPTCADKGVAIALSPEYQTLATADAARQLEIAGVRLATLLNADLAFNLK